MVYIPALDRNCVSCHQEKGALDLRGVIEGSNGWTRSYNNLAEKLSLARYRPDATTPNVISRPRIAIASPRMM